MSTESRRPDFLIIGRITKPHGVRGALKVEPITDDPDRFTELETVQIGPEDMPGDSVNVKNIQFQNKLLILTISGCESREDAEKLRNQYLYIPSDQAMELSDDLFYIYDLIGLAVYTTKNELVGTIKEYLEYPANDMFVVEKNDQEYMIPDVPEIVKSIDIKTGTMMIDPIEGLLD